MQLRTALVAIIFARAEAVITGIGVPSKTKPDEDFWMHTYFSHPGGKAVDVCIVWQYEPVATAHNGSLGKRKLGSYDCQTCTHAPIDRCFKLRS